MDRSRKLRYLFLRNIWQLVSFFSLEGRLDTRIFLLQLLYFPKISYYMSFRKYWSSSYMKFRFRSSHHRCSINKGVWVSKCHLCQSLYFNKVAAMRPAALLKKNLWHRYFHVIFDKFLRTPFLTEHLRWLLLDYWSNSYIVSFSIYQVLFYTLRIKALLLRL